MNQLQLAYQKHDVIQELQETANKYHDQCLNCPLDKCANRRREYKRIVNFSQHARKHWTHYHENFEEVVNWFHQSKITTRQLKKYIQTIKHDGLFEIYQGSDHQTVLALINIAEYWMIFKKTQYYNPATLLLQNTLGNTSQTSFDFDKQLEDPIYDEFRYFFEDDFHDFN
jgi:hypothetical protein